MIIEKGKTLNGYAISVLFMKNNADLWLSGRYFFMANTSVISASRYIIMYTNSIAITSFRGDDGITAQFLHCFQTCPTGITSGRLYYTSVFPVCKGHILIKYVNNV